MLKFKINLLRLLIIIIFVFGQILFASRAESLANAYTGISKSIESINFNPAGIGDIYNLTVKVLGTSYLPMELNINNFSILAVHPLWVVKKNVLSVIGFSYSAFSANDLYSETKLKLTSTFNFAKFRVLKKTGINKLIIGFQFENINIVYNNEINESYSLNENTKHIYNYNLGMIFNGFIDNLNIGFSLKNLSEPGLGFEDNTDNKLNRQYNLGISYNLKLGNNNLLFLLNEIFDGSMDFNLATEFSNSKISFRLGTSIIQVFGITTGFGYKFKLNGLDTEIDMSTKYIPSLSQASGLVNFNYGIKIKL